MQKQEEKDKAWSFKGKIRGVQCGGVRKEGKKGQIEKESELSKISNFPLHFSFL
jgi:hypothetical protein